MGISKHETRRLALTLRCVAGAYLLEGGRCTPPPVQSKPGSSCRSRSLERETNRP